MHLKQTWSRDDVGSPRSTSSMRMFQVCSVFSVLPARLIPSTYTDGNSPLARLANKHSRLKKHFPNRVPVEPSQIAFPMIVLPEDDRADSFREERLDLAFWTMILAICASLDVSKHLDCCQRNSMFLTHSASRSNSVVWRLIQSCHVFLCAARDDRRLVVECVFSSCSLLSDLES